MKTNIYKYTNYKDYLRDQLEFRSKSERGPKARLAEFIGCQLPYLSQILNGNAHLNLDQAEACTRFLGHSNSETLFFLNLVNHGRATTNALRKIYAEELRKTTEEQNLVKNKLELKKSLTAQNEAIYYSSWDYLAIHIATSISGFQTKQNLSEKLNISIGRVGEVLEFLVSIGLITERKGQYDISDSGFHLGSGSPFLIKHHTNWRVQAIKSLDHLVPEDLHYSSVISLNADDIPKIREALLGSIAETRKMVTDSKSEDTLMSFNVDLFSLSKK